MSALSVVNDDHAAEETLAVVEMGDPQKAEYWLGRNTKNRSKKALKIAEFAKAMKRGDWLFTGEAIKFGTDDRLLDGQNRLHAIIESGVTLPMLVIYGLDPESQEVMDTGARRTPGDALSIHGEKNSTQLAALARLILTEAESRYTGGTINHSEIIALVDNDPSVRWIVAEVVPPLKLNYLVTPAVLGYAYWRLNRIDADGAHEFFSELSEMTGLKPGSPILALHRRLSSQGRGNAGRTYRHETLACIFHSWNAWAAGEERSRIQLNRSEFGRVYIPEPKPRTKP